MLSKGKSIEEIADLTDIDIETVRKVSNECQIGDTHQN